MQIENGDMSQGVKYLTKQEMHTDQAVRFQMIWNAGNMSCCERDSLGDKSVQGKVNQWEGGKAMN